MKQKVEKTMSLTADDQGVITYELNQNSGPMKVTITKMQLELVGSNSDKKYPFSCSINGTQLVDGEICEGAIMAVEPAFKARGAVNVSLRSAGYTPAETKEFRVEVDLNLGFI